MTWAPVQDATHEASSNPTTSSVAPSSALTAGNRLIAVVVANWNTAQGTLTLSDSASSLTWHLEATVVDPVDQGVIYIYSAPIVTGGITPTITATNTVAVYFLSLSILEYSGLATDAAAIADATATNYVSTSSATAATGTTAATAAANELFLGVYADFYGNVATATPAAMTTRISQLNVGSQDFSIGDKDTGAVGAQSGSWTLSPNAGAYIAAGVVFKLAAAPAQLLDLVSSTVDALYVGATQIAAVYAGSTRVWNKTVASIANVLGSAGARSGLTFNLGLWPYRDTGTASAYTTAQQYQETQQGLDVDIDMAAQYYNAWADLEGLQILDFLDDYTPGPLPVLMLPPFLSGDTWTAAAAGTYDSHYQAIGAAIASKRPGVPTALRLAWEMNGNWYPWSIISAGGTADFIAGWQRAVTQIRSGAGAEASNLIFVYSLSGLDDKGQGDPLTVTYPGDAYVDVIGIDYYDWNPATTSATEPGRVDMLNTALAFCQAHSKQMSLDEWGLHHTGAANEGGDNPLFIEAMFTWIRANADWIAWASYFQDDALDNVNSGLFSPTVNNNPNSRAAWLTALAA